MIIYVSYCNINNYSKIIYVLFIYGKECGENYKWKWQKWQW